MDFPPRDVTPASLASPVPVLTPPGTVFPPRDVTVKRLADLCPYEDLLRDQLRRGIVQRGLLKHLKDTYNVECTLWVIKQWVAAEKKKLLVPSQVPVSTPPGTVFPPRDVAVKRLAELGPYDDPLRDQLLRGIGQAGLLKHLKDTYNVECGLWVIKQWVAAEKKKLQVSSRVTPLTMHEASLRTLLSSGADADALLKYLRDTHGLDCRRTQIDEFMRKFSRRSTVTGSSSRPAAVISSSAGTSTVPSSSSSRSVQALGSRCGEPFFIWQPGVSRSRSQIVDISGLGNSGSSRDPPQVDRGSTLDRPWIKFRSTPDRSQIDPGSSPD
jgi:hypothetical protein